jgi:hypothetical protein
MSGIEPNGGDAVEVVLTWGGESGAEVLATKYLRPGDRFVVGEGDEHDALVPAEVLGTSEVDVVSCDAAGAIVSPPAGASAWVDGLPVGDAAIRLGAGQTVDVFLGAFALRARIVEVEAAGSFSPAVEAADYGGLALSALGHVAALAALALFLPALGADDDEGITRDQILTMQHLLSASAEREQEAQEADDTKPADVAEDHGASGGGRAVGKAGKMGSENAPATAGHWSAKGDEARELQSLSRDQKQALVKDFGMLGLLATMNADPNAPTVPWGEALRGADKESHLGGLFGPDAADSWGMGGLSLSGAETGGGGYVQGLGANDVGDLSASLDKRVGSNPPGGWGHGTCGGGPCLSRGHTPGAGLRMPREIVTNGRIPQEVIQRIIRQNAGRYRACYESALRTNPSLEGRVEVRFMIDRDGQVSMAQDGSSDLPDEHVKGCIVKSFYSLSFPSPQGGTVSVVYPMVLTPAQ